MIEPEWAYFEEMRSLIPGWQATGAYLTPSIEVDKLDEQFVPELVWQPRLISTLISVLL